MKLITATLTAEQWTLIYDAMCHYAIHAMAMAGPNGDRTTEKYEVTMWRDVAKQATEIAQNIEDL